MFFPLLLLTSFSSSVLSNVGFSQDNPVPVVLWHGIFDSRSSAQGAFILESYIKKKNPNTYVLNIMIGNSNAQDRFNSMFMNANKQVANVCNMIKKDSKLQNGYHAVGFSQGAQFLRAVAQRCPTPRMYNLVSLGGQHQGIYGVPNIMFSNSIEFMAKNTSAANWFVFRKLLVPLQYWHDPTDENSYRKRNNFIADINNEKIFNQSYYDNLLKLKNLVLLKYENDDVVDPKESSWFGYYASGQKKKIWSWNETALYVFNKLPLKTLWESGRLHFISKPYFHLSLEGSIKKEIYENWLMVHYADD